MNRRGFLGGLAIPLAAVNVADRVHTDFDYADTSMRLRSFVDIYLDGERVHNVRVADVTRGWIRVLGPEGPGTFNRDEVRHGRVQILFKDDCHRQEYLTRFRTLSATAGRPWSER